MARSDRYVDEDLTKLQYKTIRKKEKKKKSWFRKIVLFVVVCGLLSCIAAGVYAALTISKAPQINPKTMYDSLNLSTNIYDDSGKVIDSVYYDENRKITKYEKLPDNLKNAFIAVEDKTFWTHHGFNFKRMIGAVLKSFGGNGITGTSTITQQLARNVYLADIKSERSVKRKIIEMYYAYVIEQTLSKEEILEGYLNTIYLGYGCYGVNSASRTYFSRDVDKLTLEQCAALAALPQAPDQYALIKSEKTDDTVKIKDGIYANDVSRDRRELILWLMVDQGLISQKDADAAKKPLTDFIKPGVSVTSANTNSYFKDYVIQCVTNDIMEELGKTKQEAVNMIYTKGLKIYTTLDSKAQNVIVKEFKNNNNFPNSVKGKKPEAAMVIVNVKTGAIKAMAGGRNPKGEQLYNRAINPRQPGSSIKPLAVYGAALQKSYDLANKNEKWDYTNYGYDKQGTSGYGDYITASSYVEDEKMIVNGKVWPYNSTGGFSGPNTFRTAIQQSINTCAVKIQLQVGTDYSAQLLKSFGLTTIVTDTSKPINDMNSASLALGGLSYGVTSLEMALAYSTFPNGGVRNSGYCYTKVVDRDGKTILTKNSEKVEVLDEGVAWIMTDVLKSVVTHGIAGDAAISKVQSAGKTGTTNDQYDIWFDGFTPNYAASLWIGTDDNVSLTTMSGPAAKLWGKIMNQIPKAKKGTYKKQPDNVIKVNGEYYTKGTEPKMDTNPRQSLVEKEKKQAEKDAKKNNNNKDDD